MPAPRRASAAEATEVLDSAVTRLVLVASGMCLVLLTYACGGGEWSVGVAVHAGRARAAFVGLSQVRLDSNDAREYPDYLSLHDLCLQNYSRPITVPLGPDGRVEMPLVETPQAVWCAFEQAGSRTSSLLSMAWLPAILALAATAVYELKTQVAPFNRIVSKAAALGLSSRLFNLFVLFTWVMLWLLVVMALTCFASLAPGSAGIGPASFGDSFALVRAMALLTSVCGMGLGAHTLQVWDVKNLVEMVKDVLESRALKRVLYLLLCAQLVLYAVVALRRIDWAALVCAVGLVYLDTKAPNMLVAYAALTVATLPLDAVLLCTLGHPASFLQWVCSTAYGLIVLCKCCSLAGMLMLHTKVKFAVKLRSEPQEELFADADKPTARDEYSA